ncbi:MAG: hypothetical protein HRT35_09250 [Algicola sp.]|nr:hypothetical protein [Algicola sp.]
MRFSLLILLWIVTFAGAFKASANDDWRTVGESKESNESKKVEEKGYKPPDMATFIQLEKAFDQAFRADDLEPLSAFYQTRLKGDGQQSLSVLKSAQNIGWGTLTLNPAATIINNEKQAMFLQVPHRFFDKWTADIANHWLQTGRFKVSMTNTVSRYLGREAKPPYNSDFSTAPNNPFVGATRAFINSFAEPLVLQLHGFNPKKRKSVDAQHADLILSHGANLPYPYLKTLTKAAACVEKDMGLKALVYPKDVQELGGTKNLVGKQLRKKGYFQRFIHIEMSDVLRKKLRDSSELSIQLLNCILGIK